MRQNKNNKFTKIVLLLVLIALPMMGLSCGGNKQTEGKITLTMWKPFTDSDKMNVIIQAYKKVKPNVTIEYTKKNIENYEDDLLNALASNRGPDIFSINNSWLPSYLDKVEPAPEKLYTIKEYRDAFVDVVSDDLIRDNKIYGTALWVDSLGLYYNKDLLGTAGIATPAKTWDDLARHSRQMTRQSSDGYFERSGVAMGTSDNVNRGVDIVYLLMLQAGAVPWSDDGRTARFASSIQRGGQSVNPGSEGVEFYTSFANPASDNYTWNLESDYSTDAFANGRAAYLYGYNYTRSQIDAKAPNLNYDVAPVPQFDAGQPNVNYASYFAETVSKQSKNKAAAWDFLKFATSQKTLDAYYAKDKQPSSRRDLIEMQTQDVDMGVFAHANLTAKSMIKYDEERFDTIFNELIDNVLLRGQSISSSLSRAQSQVNNIVQDRLF